MKRKGCKIKKFQIGGIDISPNSMWNTTNNLDAFQLQGQQIANQTSPYMEIADDSNNSLLAPYQVNQKPLNQTKVKRDFGLNAKNYTNLQMLNSGIDAIGNRYNQGQQNQSIINQNPLSSMQFSNGRSNQSKYGYSFQRGGTKQNPPKVYTDQEYKNNPFVKAKYQMYLDSLNLYNYTDLQKRLEGNQGKAPLEKVDKEMLAIEQAKPTNFFDKGIKVLNNSFHKQYKDVNKNNIEDVITYAVTNPNDFALKADMKTKIAAQKYINKDGITSSYKKPTKTISVAQQQNNQETLLKFINQIKSPYILDRQELNSPDIMTHKYIDPIGGYVGANTGAINYDYSNTFPKQPIIIQKPQTINTTKGLVKGKVIQNDGKNAAVWNSQLVQTKPTHPTTNMKRLSMSKQDLGNPNIQIQGQTISLPEMRLSQQGNIPFYGPGNTIIGYTDDNRQFYPALQYTGAANNQFNLQDKELLNNLELLRKYVQSKDTYKFQRGGFKWDNEDDDFLFGDDEEETTNVVNQPRQTDEEVVNQELQPEVNQEEDINNALYADLMTPYTRRGYKVRQPYQAVEDTDYSTGPTLKINPSANKTFAFNYLQQKGLAPHQAAGIVGNFAQESNVNPSITNSIGAFGAGQWLGARKKALFDFAKRNGQDPANLQTQLDFTMYELNTTEKGAFNALKNTKTSAEAAKVIRKKYERPGEHEANDNRRVQEALKLHPYQKGGINDNNGYLTSNLHNFTPKKIINSNHITTQGMAFPIQANGIPLYPNTGDYIFPTDKVVEKPLYLTGGYHYVDNSTIANLKQKRIKFRYV